MSWDEVFRTGFSLGLKQYMSSKSKYFKRETDLCRSLLHCFWTASEEKRLPLEGIQQEMRLIGKTRVDFLLGNEVSVEEV